MVLNAKNLLFYSNKKQIFYLKQEMMNCSEFMMKENVIVDQMKHLKH